MTTCTGTRLGSNKCDILYTLLKTHFNLYAQFLMDSCRESENDLVINIEVSCDKNQIASKVRMSFITGVD